MNVKQIDEKTALELAACGEEVLIMMPMLPSLGWAGMKADTLQNVLSGFLFFQEEAGAPVEVLDGISAADFIKQEAECCDATAEGCDVAAESCDAAAEDADPDPIHQPKKDGRRKKAGPKKMNIDTGKLLAIHNAGWSAKKIADEMGISEGTVWNRISQMKNRKTTDGESYDEIKEDES